MKSKMNIKSIVIMAIIGIISLFFINMSFAANTGKINVETANLRETADENGKILEQFSINDEVEVIEKVEDWYKVKAKGITGYIRQDLITVNNEVKENNNTLDVNENTQKAEEVSTEEQENKELGKKFVKEDSKLKIVPVINATDIIEVKKSEEVEVTEVINGWACVETNTTKGWIRKEKLEDEKAVPVVAQEPQKEEQEKANDVVIKTLFVKATTVNLRKEANTTSEIIATLPLNTAVDVLEELDGWNRVKVSGKEGYISSSYLATTKQETSRSQEKPRKTQTTTTQTSTNKTTEIAKPAENTGVSNSSGNGSSVVAYAKQFIGVKYKSAGSSPSTGFDCSGFTSYVYKNFGVNLPRTSGGQATVGRAVNRANLQPGDLVIYSGHVAIYVGGGQVIHSPRPGKTVCIVPIDQAKPGCYQGARRVL